MSANHTVNSITTRGAIDVTALVCVPCKKKHGGAGTCYAHTMSSDGKPICIFCEDGEACMFEQRQAKAAKKSQISVVNKNLTPTAIPAVRVPAPPQQFPVQQLADRLRVEGLPEADIHAALIAQGYKARDVKKVLPQPEAQSKEKPMETAAVRPNGHAPAPTPAIRLCGRPGCGKQLRPTNGSGYCQKHFYDSKRSESAKAKAETKAANRGTKRAKAETSRRRPAQEKLDRYVAANTTPFSLQVTEAQLDRFLNGVDWNPVISKLPAELKLQLANHYFAAGLDQVEAKAEAAA